MHEAKSGDPAAGLKARSPEALNAMVEEHLPTLRAGALAFGPSRPDAEALDAELRAWIETCAERLSLSQRTAFFLEEVEGETPEAIGNVLGVSGTNLMVLLHRARLKLRECLEARWERSR